MERNSVVKELLEHPAKSVSLLKISVTSLIISFIKKINHKFCIKGGVSIKAVFEPTLAEFFYLYDFLLIEVFTWTYLC